MSHPHTVAGRPPDRPRGDRFAALPSGRRSRWLILVAWLAGIAVLMGGSGDIESVERNDAAQWLPRGAESLDVAELQAQFGQDEVMPAVAVYHRDGGLGASDLDRIEQDRRAVDDRFPTTPAERPVTSEDGKAAYFTIPLQFPMTGDGNAVEDVEDLRDIVGASDDGLSTAVTGPAGLLIDEVAVFDGIDSTLLVASALVVMVILVLTYRSPLLWLLPLMTVGVSVMAAMAVTYWLARAEWITVTGMSGGLLPIFAFGVGTDYALLITARYREELRRFEQPRDAMRSALRRAAPAIFASSGTCIVGLLALLAADLNSTRGIGAVGIIAIASALLAMLTLFPALATLLGRRLFWPFVPRLEAEASTEPEPRGVFGRIGRWLAPHPRRAWVLVVALLALATIGVAGIDTRMEPADQFVDEPESIRGQALISEHFASGSGTPTTVIASAAAAEAVETAIHETPGVAGVEALGASGDLVAMHVTLDAPPRTDAAFDAIEALRERVQTVRGAGALVGGPDAEAYDIEQTIARDWTVVGPLVLALVLVMLAVLLRSLVAPLLLVGTVVLSFGAALGVSTLAFEHVFGFAAIDPSIPLLAFVFLVALGIDYNIFLMTRVQEETRAAGTRRGILRGLAVTGGVITSAGLVLAATFSVLALMPLVGMAQLGFIVALGVLLDTFVVRSLLVPALALDLGRVIWWPGRLARAPEGELDPVRETAAV